jgi:aminoglycoside phosphotransferase family enzyme/predicted kinase
VADQDKDGQALARAMRESRRLIEALLAGPEPYPHDTVDPLKPVETHAAWVILTGDWVYKIKKPVDFGFLDYSTLDRRRFCCEEEIRLNRRYAADIYRDVVAITGDRDAPRIDGAGPVLEYAVRMRQFPPNGLLSELAGAGRLQIGHIDQVVSLVAGFHESTDRVATSEPFGDADQVHRWVVENFKHIRPLLADDDAIARLAGVERWTGRQRRELDSVFAQRKRQGFVRECHGDLHLGNLTLIDGRVTLFDCIEFNAGLRWIDVMSDVAFLVMDLAESGYPQFANHFLNGYLQETGDYEGLRLLPYYLVYRALVRAKVAMLRSRQADADSADFETAHRDYGNYMRFAEQTIDSPMPALVVTHGVSGSGKSTAARALCETRDLIWIRSDVERKRLAGLGARQSSGSGIDAGLYAREQTEATYERLRQLAETVVRAGFGVVVDATFLHRPLRERFRALAERLQAPFLILDCVADESVLRERIARRQATAADPSEATVEVLEQQQRTRDPLDQAEKSWSLSVDTATAGWRQRLRAQYSRHTVIGEDPDAR